MRSIALLLATLLTLKLKAESQSPQTIEIWPREKVLQSGEIVEEARSTLTLFAPPNPNGTAVVICPGGGYGQVVGAEGAPIAKWLNSQGITGLVLNYRLPKGDPQRPLNDVRRAIQITKAHHKEWNLKPSQIGVMGFSAGGHLAGMAITKFRAGDPQGSDAISRQSSRPDFAILIYPVVTLGEGTHSGSRQNLLGPNPSKELIDLYSNELHVSLDTPPTFLAHAADDQPVPPLHSAKFHDALLSKKIKTQYLQLPSGGHGLNGYQGPMWEAWQKASMRWLKSLELRAP